MIYLGLKLLVIPVQVLTGFIYMFYIYPDNPVHVEGLSSIALLHTLGAFTLLAFVVAHVYLTTTGDTPLSSIKAMLTGWEVVDVDQKDEHKQHMQHAVDDSSAGYYRLDPDGNFVDVNEAWLTMFKCKDRNQIIGKHYSLAREPKNLKELDRLVEKVMKGGYITGIPATRKCMDGSKGKHVLSANPVFEEGNITGMEGFILDINEKDELSEHMFYAVKNSGAGYYRLDAKGTIMDVNEAWLEFYKYNSKEEIIGKNFAITRRPSEVEKLENTFKKVMSGETISGRLAWRLCKDGSIGKHILSANPSDVGNKVVGMEGFIVDITKLEDKVEA